ncbi:MAG: M67 family metallopeptidase [Candidatus Acidiferrales bacterium]
MGLRISEDGLNIIRRHAGRDYPNECCGAMLGMEINGAKEVVDLAPLTNLRGDRARADELLPLASPERESERNRFLIDPFDMQKVEREARAQGLDVIGFYHSHPDHPARPSNYDRDHAFPWYSYVIIAVQAGQPGPFASFTLREDRSSFEEEAVEVLAAKKS